MNAYDEISSRDVEELSALPPPVRRAAYSDRTAWMMAIFAELAYIRFESQPFQEIRELAKELLNATGVDEVEQRLLQLQHYFAKPPEGDGEALLRTILEAAGFELVGTFFNHSLDLLKNTEGFVAQRVQNDGNDYAVLAIRGTTSPQDWRNNAHVGLESIGGGREVHKGFHRAYTDAEEQISALLRKTAGLPLFICGHSLGGAVAVMATWYQKRDSLAACYTYGAPRVGNHTFNDAFKTPVYRIVNGFDPVPSVPPSSFFLSVVKALANTLLFFIPGGRLIRLNSFLENIKGYRHAGFLHYMTAGEMDAEGRYPTVRHYTQFSSVDRLQQLWQHLSQKKLKRLDTYHKMQTYRRKLRCRALTRAPR
jgi:triacylglycerol lipase